MPKVPLLSHEDNRTGSGVGARRADGSQVNGGDGTKSALSALEAMWYGRWTCLTSEFGCPLGTVIDRQAPSLVAR